MFQEGNLTKSKLFFISCLFFILGVGLGTFFRPSIFLSYTIILFFTVILVLFWNNKLFRVGALAGIFLFLGIMRFTIDVPEVDASKIQFYNEEEITFSGVVSEEPDRRSDHTKLTVKAQRLNDNFSLKGRVLLNTGLFPEYQYGDELEITCRLQTPEPIEDFRYDKYLARYNIYSLCYYPKKILKISENERNFLKGAILKIKSKFVFVVNRIYPEPQASFLGGLLYGARRGIPDNLMEDFNRTGVTHIIAISGYNITILAVISQKLLQGIYISRKKAFWITILLIIFFVIITGASASVTRAAVMGVLALLATQVGRLSRVGNVLVFAAALMLAVNPKVLVYDVGWQLSFLATLGLVYLSPLISGYLRKIPEFSGVKESFISTMAAIIFTLPVILLNFGRLSLVAPLANMMILPVIPWAMAFGFISVALGSIYIFLGQIVGAVAWFILTYIIKIVEIFSELEWASFEMGEISASILFLYALLVFFISYKNKKLKTAEIKI